MTIRPYHFLFIALTSLLLSGCGLSLWEKDNTPPPTALTEFKAKVHPQLVWDNRSGANLNNEYLKLGPALANNEVITSDQFGNILAVDKNTGHTLWKTFINAPVTSGPVVNNNIIVVGTKNGEVIALSQLDRRILWKASVESEILATPAMNDNLVLIKSIDGKVTAFSASKGQHLWVHREVEPSLILRGASAPQITGSAVVIGYASGKVVKLALKDGHELWAQTITIPDGAFAIQRMIDVDADPVVSGNSVFAVTYQGKIAALNLSNGNILWDHDLSSYAGITADEARVYVSDAKSNVWAFDRENGRIVWKQTQLEARNITGPVIMTNYLIVGDAEGALHWLNKEDGSFAGRVQFGGSGILANPTIENKTAYTISKDGYLTAYVIN